MAGAKVSFELDAGKILAKLHRGGCQTHAGMMFFNSGITDDQKGLTPENVGKAKISFDMENGEYELGVIIQKEIEIKLTQDMQLSGEVAAGGNGAGSPEDYMKEKSPDDVKKYLEEKKKDLAELDDKDWKTLYGEFQEKHKGQDVPKEDEFRKAVEATMKEKFGSDSGSEDKNASVTENPSEAGKKPVSEAVEKPNDVRKLDPEKFTELAGAALDVDGIMSGDEKKPIQDLKELKKNAGEAGQKAADAVEKNHDAVKKVMEGYMENAAGYLQEYMTVFAGEDEAKNVKKEVVEVTFVPEKFSDPYVIKKYPNYQIPAMTDEEVRKMKIDQIKQAMKDRKLVLKNMCFKIAYSLDVGR